MKHWRGIPCMVKHGRFHIRTASMSDWYAYELNKANVDLCYIPALLVESLKGEFPDFYLGNHFGIGVHHLNRGGLEDHPEFIINLKGKFTQTATEANYSLDEDAYFYHEKMRKEWFDYRYRKPTDEIHRKGENLKGMFPDEIIIPIKGSDEETVDNFKLSGVIENESTKGIMAQMREIVKLKHSIIAQEKKILDPLG